MAARGTVSKQVVMEKILNTFNGAFVNGKEIRIPLKENGEEIQIKVSLTAAKDNITSPYADVDIDNAELSNATIENTEKAKEIANKVFSNEPTEEEKNDLEALVANLF